MKKYVKKFLPLGIFTVVLGALVLAAIIFFFNMNLPEINSLSEYEPKLMSQIISKDGEVISDIGDERREIVSIDNVPQIILDSFLSAEDDKFYEHKGVDYFGVIRAMIANLKAGRIVQGGSTITQQVAKSLLLTREKSITRKIKDFLLAQKIEEKFTKKEILYLYLNQVYLGGGYHGIKTAFKGYFGKELEEATVAESALVAGLLVAPGRYSPYRNPEYAKKRQRYVLSRLKANKKITEAQYEEAINESIKLKVRDSRIRRAGYFSEWVKQRVLDLIGEEKMLLGGYKIMTTLDWKLQQVAEKEAKKGLEEIDKRQGFQGPIKTMDISSEDFEKFEFDFRTKFFRKASQYFMFMPDGTNQYELVFNEEDYKKLRAYREANALASKKFLVGNPSFEKMSDFMSRTKKYKAVVLKVDNRNQLFYVSVGGTRGIVAQPGFSWAHERVVDEKSKWFHPVTKPSKIVKPGDVVYIKIKSRSKSLWNILGAGQRSRYKKSSDIKFLKSNKFMNCDLDQEPAAEVALLSMNPLNGEIISMVGGYDFLKSQFNRTYQSVRQPGSSFKPFLFAAALEHGYTASTIILDSPEALGGVSDDSLNWKPRNYDGKFMGPVTFRRSLELSRNVPTVKIAADVGINNITKFTRRLKLNSKIQDDLSVALGSFGATLMDLVATYGIFPNGGLLVQPKSILSITDRNGEEIDISTMPEWREISDKKTDDESDDSDKKSEPSKVSESSKDPGANYVDHLSGNRVLDKRLAYVMSNILKGIVQRGTGGKARELGPIIGGKTGTTSNYVDAWFIGFSSNVVTGVWAGFDNNKSLGFAESGSKAALPIWKEFMRAALARYGKFDLKVPKGIINVKINPETGRLATSLDEKTFMESFVEGTEPGSSSAESSENGSDQSYEEDDYFNQE